LICKKLAINFPFKIVNEESSFRGRITPLQADGKTRASDKKRTAVLSMTIADPSANYIFLIKINGEVVMELTLKLFYMKIFIKQH
jgi:hypothetical protein